MFYRKFARTGLALSLTALSTLSFIGCSEQPQTPATSQQPSVTQQQPATQQAATTQSSDSTQTATPMTKEQLEKLAQERAMANKGLSKEEISRNIKAVDPALAAKYKADNRALREEYVRNLEKIKGTIAQPPPVAKADPNRELLAFHKYLTEKNGIAFNPAQEMPGGADVWKADDIIQMTLDDAKVDSKRVAVMVAKYKKSEDQSKGLEFMMQLTSDGRTKAYSVGNYNVVIRGGNDSFHNTVKSALEKFAKKS